MKRMLPWLITVLLAITLIIVAAFLLFNYWQNDTKGSKVDSAISKVEAKRLSADDIVAVTSEITDIKTNLADSEYIVMMGFAFQLDSKKTKAEFDKIKDINIKPIIIKTLADVQHNDLNGAKGKDQVTAKLTNLINAALPSGKLIKIDITDFIMTSI
ncbi:flagellar basal body protein FliL [Paenibacillus selenitireducens]|uniref:Flagellar protein FliL n=1 Tax=Paenibacillus selenitireducens TaxID=1324314 RepID=A0A1T2XCI6_9BACL|nr:flagellar basal body-associated FliL family protein [Paenibacillus selenitireducens]OPA77601.1 flagellar basal body protein FliL [Paenibacillus selenitireducens]